MRVDRLLKLMDLRPQSGSGEHRVGGGALAGVNQPLTVVANARAIMSSDQKDRVLDSTRR